MRFTSEETPTEPVEPRIQHNFSFEVEVTDARIWASVSPPCSCCVIEQRVDGHADERVAVMRVFTLGFGFGRRPSRPR